MEAITSLGPFLIPITAIVVGGVITIVVLILRHQERIAKIERGIDPDQRRQEIPNLSWASAATTVKFCNGPTSASRLTPNIG